MKGRMIGAFAVVLCVVCLLGVAAGEEIVSYTMDGNHITGELCVNGFTFDIDALLETSDGSMGKTVYSRKETDHRIIEEALAACFPQTSAALIKNLSIDQATASASILYVAGSSDIYPAVLPHSQTTGSTQLQDALDRSVAFCEMLGLSVSPQPLSCAYTTSDENDRCVRLSVEDAQGIDAEIFMEVWLLQSVDDCCVIPNVQISRYNGKVTLNGSDDVLTISPGAKFYFNAGGDLLSFEVSLIEAAAAETTEKFLTWQDALMLFLKEYTSSERIQQNLQTLRYTVTSIRTAWDMTEQNEGRKGWLLALSATSPSETSPTGWKNRYYMGFVDGGTP